MQVVNSLRGVVWSVSVVGCLAATASGDVVTFVEGGVHCTIELTASPDVGEWDRDDPLPASATASSSGGYALILHRGEHTRHPYWTVEVRRSDGEEFAIVDWQVTARVPLGKVATLFSSQVPQGDSLFRQSPQIDVAMDVRPNAQVPFLMACDHYGRNSLAFGPMDQHGTYRMSARRDGGDYVMTSRRNEYPGDGWWRGRRFLDNIFVSTRNDFWFDTATAYANAVDAERDYRPRRVPDSAYLPYYSTWYAFGDKIDAAIVWDNAQLAAEMGINNFLIFIGWSECENWFSSDNAWGDYEACESRFDDLAGLIERMHDELDLRVVLWTAPTWVGANSDAFERVEDLRSKWPEGGYDRNLDPRSPEARDHIRAEFAGMAERLDADGYYVDFLDTVYNRNDAPHEKDPELFGAALQDFVDACYDGFAPAANGIPIVMFRTPFANLLTKPAASVFVTTYTDGDWQRSRQIAIAHRPFQHGVVSATDPLTWSQEAFEDRDMVGKALSAMMLLGPPAISMDLRQIDEGRRAELGRWFAFYESILPDLKDGRFVPIGDEYQAPEMMVSNGDTSYVWVSRWETDHFPFPKGTTHAYIFTNLPRDPSFIARIDLTNVTGLKPGVYQGRWYNSTVESHDPPFEVRVPDRDAPASSTESRTARENWDFHPDEERPSLDIKRGGFLELQYKRPLD